MRGTFIYSKTTYRKWRFPQEFAERGTKEFQDALVAEFLTEFGLNGSRGSSQSLHKQKLFQESRRRRTGRLFGTHAGRTDCRLLAGALGMKI